ncbi:MAG: hypothetical protein FWD23_10365 [Oscillospiraceae bacterium]|nr:hypothetical protein [Oscillospiraceae bacterium]
MNYLQPASDKKALSPAWFAAGFQAVIWRNWGLVPPKNIAAALNCTECRLRQSAAELGLDPKAEADPIWLKRGYLTIIRRNWHIASYGQITTLLGTDEKQLAFILKEDDFMWAKMGGFKPSVEDNVHRELTAEEKLKTGEIKEAVARYGEQFDFGDNSFDFLDKFYNPQKSPEIAVLAAKEGGFRIAYSYFAVFGDPLLDESLDPYPDELLRQYAELGVNGVWLQGILYQLSDFAFDPELSSDREKRISNLKKLIARAAKYNIGVYLYMNEPRAMPKAFFDKHPQLKGETEYDTFALCTSRPEVREYLYGAMKQLFTEAEGLAGFIAITMSENLTNCYSRVSPAHIKCERCKARTPAQVVAEVNNILAKGAHDAAPSAKAISWTWAWGADWAGEAVDMLSEGQIIQCTSEEGLITDVGGVKGSVVDYTISQPGPGEKSKSIWKHAAARGFALSAKVQINNTWELSNIPYIPAFDLIGAHIKNLKRHDISNLQLCWTLGGYPSLNMRFVDYLMKTPEGTAAGFLKLIFGEQLGEKVHAAQRQFSEAFADFPFDVGTAYTAPQNFGVMAPFYAQKTGYAATMMGFPYDDIDSWRAIYPIGIYESQMQKTAGGMERAVCAFEKIEDEKNAALWEIVTNAKAAACHMRSVCNHTAYIRAREAKDAAGAAKAAQDEKNNVIRLIKLRQTDSRIGFEASNHYFYTVADLVEKLLNLDFVIRGSLVEQ